MYRFEGVKYFREASAEAITFAGSSAAACGVFGQVARRRVGFKFALTPTTNRAQISM
jgi:hypothetical protein